MWSESRRGRERRPQRRAAALSRRHIGHAGGSTPAGIVGGLPTAIAGQAAVDENLLADGQQGEGFLVPTCNNGRARTHLLPTPNQVRVACNTGAAIRQLGGVTPSPGGGRRWRRASCDGVTSPTLRGNSGTWDTDASRKRLSTLPITGENLTLEPLHSILSPQSIDAAEVASRPEAKAAKGKPVPVPLGRKSGAVPQLWGQLSVFESWQLSEPGYPPRLPR
jgi:hypothetical protein